MGKLNPSFKGQHCMRRGGGHNNEEVVKGLKGRWFVIKVLQCCCFATGWIGWIGWIGWKTIKWIVYEIKQITI